MNPTVKFHTNVSGVLLHCIIRHKPIGCGRQVSLEPSCKVNYGCFCLDKYQVIPVKCVVAQEAVFFKTVRVRISHEVAESFLGYPLLLLVYIAETLNWLERTDCGNLCSNKICRTCWFRPAERGKGDCDQFGYENRDQLRPRELCLSNLWEYRRVTTKVSETSCAGHVRLRERFPRTCVGCGQIGYENNYRLDDTNWDQVMLP